MSSAEPKISELKPLVKNQTSLEEQILTQAKSLATSPIKDLDDLDKDKESQSSKSTSLPIPVSKLELDFPASFSFDPVPPLSFDNELIDSITSKAESIDSDNSFKKSPQQEQSSFPRQETLIINEGCASSIATSTKSHAIKANSVANSTSEKEFKYHLFLDQVRLPQALSIMKYLENFVREFDKKPWSTRDQVRIVGEFSDFILGKMLDNPVWKDAVDLDNYGEAGCFSSENDLIDFLQEGAEQYLMNRLHNLTFSPQGSDDRERDHVLYQRIQYFQWIEERHLDIPVVSKPHRNLLTFAQEELLKLNKFKTPRHKMICLLNCCKYLFKLLKTFSQNSEGAGADNFLPLLIFTVLRANPPKLISNLQYISRFRHPAKLQSEAGYYLTHLIGAIQFIENLEPTSLTISKEEFDANIEKTLEELTADIPQDGDDKLLLLDNSNSTSNENAPQTNSSLQDSSSTDLYDRGSQFAQRIKRPLDLVGRFFSDVASPMAYPFRENESSTPESFEHLNKPIPVVNPPDEFRKKKSFLVSLFSKYSSDEEELFENDQDSNSKQKPNNLPLKINQDEGGQELISFSTESASCAPPLPPRHSSIITESKDSKPKPKELNPIREKESQPASRSDPLMLDFDQGINILRDMFPSFEHDVLLAVLSAQRGNLTAATEALLEIAEVNNPYSPQYQEQFESENTDQTTDLTQDLEAADNLIDLEHELPAENSGLIKE